MAQENFWVYACRAIFAAKLELFKLLMMLVLQLVDGIVIQQSHALSHLRLASHWCTRLLGLRILGAAFKILLLWRLLLCNELVLVFDLFVSLVNSLLLISYVVAFELETVLVVFVPHEWTGVFVLLALFLHEVLLGAKDEHRVVLDLQVFDVLHQ